MAAGNQSHGDTISDINVTPLVDVMLVLLVVLMVTASFAVSKSLDLNLPKAATGESNSTPLTVVIDRQGGLSMDGEKLDKSQLATRLRGERSSGQEPTVILAADAVTEHQYLVAAIDLLRSEHITHISIGVAPAE